MPNAGIRDGPHLAPRLSPRWRENPVRSAHGAARAAGCKQADRRAARAGQAGYERGVIRSLGMHAAVRRDGVDGAVAVEEPLNVYTDSGACSRSRASA
jgi:hypothetical protein